MVRVKICGITNADDALHAVESGADALGFVFHEKSPRYIAPEKAEKIIDMLPPFVQSVGVFVNLGLAVVNEIAERCCLDIVQLHGEEPPSYCDQIERRVMKGFRIKDIMSLDPMKHYNVAAFLLDAYSPRQYGGTGMTFNWDTAKVAKEFGKPVVLAGGLTIDNVRQAVDQVVPYGVDVSSGVEQAPGKKDHVKVREFIRRAKLI